MRRTRSGYRKRPAKEDSDVGTRLMWGHDAREEGLGATAPGSKTMTQGRSPRGKRSDHESGRDVNLGYPR